MAIQGIDFTFCELREKEVVNMADGKRLGRMVDVALSCSGRLVGIILPGDRKFLKSITSNENIFVPWQNVRKIGDDVILVELVCRNPEYFDEHALTK